MTELRFLTGARGAAQFEQSAFVGERVCYTRIAIACQNLVRKSDGIGAVTLRDQPRLACAEFVEASAGLLMINAAASIPGPLLASFVISTAGPYSLFLYTAIAHAAMAFYAFTRMRITEPAPVETRETFAPVAQGSPVALELDPRGPAQEKTP